MVLWSTNFSDFWISKSSSFFPQQLVLLAYCAASSLRLYLMSMRFSYLYSMKFFKKQKQKTFSHTSSEGRAFFHPYVSFLLLLHFFSISLLFHRKKKSNNRKHLQKFLSIKSVLHAGCGTDCGLRFLSSNPSTAYRGMTLNKAFNLYTSGSSSVKVRRK